jgi:hypothetical protein
MPFSSLVARTHPSGSGGLPALPIGSPAGPRRRDLPASYMERHRAMTLVTAVLLLVSIGLLVGVSVGTLGVQVIESVLPATSPGP